MSAPRAFQLTIPGGGSLDGYINLPAAAVSAGAAGTPIVVACHGFKGFMEWGFFPYWADRLSDAGFAVVRFNFSGAGMRPGDEVVTDLAAFRNATVSRDLVELLGILDAVVSGELALDGADRSQISLFGHSRGGAVALLAAAHPAWHGRIQSLVTWAAVGRLERLDPEQVAAWRRSGALEILNVRTGQRLKVGLDALQDFEEHRRELDLFAAARRRSVPWLIVHGDRDETIPHAEAAELHAAATPPRELLIVAGGDHGLGGRHPFPGPRPPLAQALERTIEWYRSRAAARESAFSARA